jgi:NAD(P)-dependent dehydrogenase (short-subunit alcohol dehydrogenase family)
MTSSRVPALTRFLLDGRVAIVTGAAGLLGAEHCAALAAAGARVVATDLVEERCVDLARRLSREGLLVEAVAADVTQAESLIGLRDAVLARFGHIDVLVNNAAIDEKVDRSLGSGTPSAFETLALASWKRAIDVNLTGVFLCCQILGTPMAVRKSGSIINVASTYGLVAPDQRLYRREDGTQAFYKSAAYPTTKAGVLGLTRYLAAYWSEAGVRVNALCPGGVENGQDPAFVARYAQRTPLGRMAHTDEYHGALIFLASEASSYMTGANLVVDGGFTAW